MGPLRARGRWGQRFTGAFWRTPQSTASPPLELLKRSAAAGPLTSSWRRSGSGWRPRGCSAVLRRRSEAVPHESRAEGEAAEEEEILLW